MKVLLASINAKYIHSSLATRYLRNYCKIEADIQIGDYSINDDIDNIIADVYRINPDVLGFSCYIWNVEQTLKVAEAVKEILPQVKIVFGGPEVSFSAKRYLESHDFLDAVVYGEGEATFKDYLLVVKSGMPPYEVKGLAYRHKEIVYLNPPRELIDFSNNPFPYEDNDFTELNNKILYYETSRGCAFACSYCLSSTMKGVRFLNTDRIKDDIEKFISAGVKQVKFVDRTFNISKKHAMQVWQIIAQYSNTRTNFHFEIAADLLDDEMIELLGKFPPGLIQLEIGVQSTNPETLEAVNRKSDLDRLFLNVNKLRKANNIHLHLDLIAGLPHENMLTFEKSFNNIYELQPHHLQLGFLKILSGTKIGEQKEQYGIVARKYAPYEVLKTKGFTYEELLELKEIEDTVEIYYNSHHYVFFLSYILQKWKEGSFALYKEFAAYLSGRKEKKMSHNIKTEFLLKFASSFYLNEQEVQKEILVLDLLCNQKQLHQPEWLGFDEMSVKQITSTAVKNTEFITKYLPQYVNVDWRSILKHVLIVPASALASQYIFGINHPGFAVFDYKYNDPLTGRFSVKYYKEDAKALLL